MRSKRLLSCRLGLYSLLLWMAASPAAELEQNPVVEAINLVAMTQQAEIKAVDKGDWWFDTSVREWSVRRPFGPGTIDSTHLLDVTYKIDGKPVMSWQVDLRTRKVEKRR